MALIWITGTHGFIGRHLARMLSAQGHRIAGIGHGTWPKENAELWGVSTWINGDISASNLSQVKHISGIPDRVFHLAGGSSVGTAFASPHEDFTRTVVSTSELLEWLRQNAPTASIVAVSSAAVYGSGHSGKIAEDARLIPFSPYGAHKLMMEDLCHSYADNFGLKIVLSRLFSIYGPEIKKQLLWDLCCKFAKDGPVQLGGTGKELRDWTNVCDAGEALGQIIGLANKNILTLNIATGIATSIHDIATIMASHWGGASTLDRLQFSGQSRPGDPFSLVADTEKMQSYGIECSMPVIQGVVEYVDWYKSLKMGSL